MHFLLGREIYLFWLMIDFFECNCIDRKCSSQRCRKESHRIIAELIYEYALNMDGYDTRW